MHVLVLLALAACSSVEAPVAPAALRGPEPARHELAGDSGEALSGRFDLVNDGGSAMTLDTISGASWLAVQPGGRRVVPAGERATVRFVATCPEVTEDVERRATLTFATSDPARPFAFGEVRLSCRGGTPSPEGDPGGSDSDGSDSGGSDSGGSDPDPADEPAPGDDGADAPPYARIAADPVSGSAEAPVTVTFSAADSYDDEGEIVHYAWSIDGSHYEGVTARHTFDAAGSFDVHLSVQDERGNIAATSLAFDVEGGGTTDPEPDPEPEPEPEPEPDPEPEPEPDPEPEPTDGFDITVVFYGSRMPTATQRQAFQNAANRWAEIIADDLPDRTANLSPGSCFGRDHPSYREFLDDVLIFASVEWIDGVNGTLAAAGPCRVSSATGLPYAGLMEFDEADVAQLEAEGLFEATVLHEMGHVLGIGTLWEDLRDFVDPVGTDCGSGSVGARFNGGEATRQHGLLGGAGRPYVETDGGPGTACGHWDEGRYATELMTGYIDRSMPLSRMTVGSLQDLGYGIDYAAADDYRVPSGLSLQGRETGRHLEEILLRPSRTAD